jgi:hypothetical protein
MSRIFLPNGGQIEIKSTWVSFAGSDGATNYYTNSQKGTLLLEITPAGIVHISKQCEYIYHPPPINSLDATYDTLSDQVKNLKPWQLKELKKKLEEFNAKSYSWK